MNPMMPKRSGVESFRVWLDTISTTIIAVTAVASVVLPAALG